MRLRPHEYSLPVTLTVAVISRRLRSNALRLRMLIRPAGESASMLAVVVLLISITSVPVIEDCSNSNWRESPPNDAEGALAIVMPSTLTEA